MRRHPRVSAWAVAAMSVAMAATFGCERGGDRADAGAPAAPISQVHTAGDAASPSGVVRLSVDRASMTVADRLRVTIRIESVPGAGRGEFDPPLPQPPTGRLGEWTVASLASRELPAQSGRSVVEHLLVLEPFLEGSKSVPPLRVRFAGDSGVLEVSTEPVSVEVTSVLSEQDRQADELPLSPAPESVALTLPRASKQRLSWPVVAGAASACAVAIGVVVVAGRRRRIKAVDPVADARAKLSAIQGRLTAAAAEPFGQAVTGLSDVASELASVARRYVDHALGVAAIGATVDELAGRLASEPRLSQQAGDVQALLATLRSLEQEAFAPSQPRAAVLAEHLAVVDRFITATAATVTAGGPGERMSTGDRRAA